MENISVIKVVSIYSKMIWYHFTVDWYVYHHSMPELLFVDKFGLNFFPKRFCMHRSCLTLPYGRTHVKLSNRRHTLSSLLSSHNANLHATLVRRQLEAAFSNHKILLILSFKWHYKSFSWQTVLTHNIIPNKCAEPSRINEKWLGKKLMFPLVLVERKK